MNKIAPIILTILIAGGAGFAAGRATSGLDARIAASGAAIAAGEGCAANARGTWPIGVGGPTVEARVFGADCANATAVLVISGADGPQYQTALATPWVFGLAGAMTPVDMTAALSQWITPTGPRTTADLPRWFPGAEVPEAEFPFYPSGDFDQETYEAMRAAGDPVFCFAQGLESMRCLRESGGVLEDIGTQAFPGG